MSSHIFEVGNPEAPIFFDIRTPHEAETPFFQGQNSGNPNIYKVGPRTLSFLGQDPMDTYFLSRYPHYYAALAYFALHIIIIFCLPDRESFYKTIFNLNFYGDFTIILRLSRLFLLVLISVLQM